MTSIRSLIAGLAAGALLAVSAAAQSAPDNNGGGAGGGAPITPSETKPFGDWTVRCFPVQKSPSPCDMFELLANKKSGDRVMSVSIAYLPATDKHVIQIAVPLGVLIQKGVVLSSDNFTSPVLRYRRCDRGGCYVEMLFDNQAVNALASSTGPAKIKVVAFGGKSFEIPFSLTGFSDAHGAMTDLARKKVASSGAAAPAAPAAGGAAPAGGDTPAPAPADPSKP
jgi:invasion protein IalB